MERRARLETDVTLLSIIGQESVFTRCQLNCCCGDARSRAQMSLNSRPSAAVVEELPEPDRPTVLSQSVFIHRVRDAQHGNVKEPHSLGEKSARDGIRKSEREKRD